MTKDYTLRQARQHQITLDDAVWISLAERATKEGIAISLVINRILLEYLGKAKVEF